MVPEHIPSFKRRILFQQINKGMRLWGINGLRCKQLKLVILAFFMLFFLWKWEKGTYDNSKILHPDSLVLTDPANSKFVDQHTSSEEDFPSADPFPQSVVHVEKQVIGVLPPMSIVGDSVDVADEKEASPSEAKANSKFVDQHTSSEEDFPSADPFPQSVVHVEKQVIGALPPMSIVGDSVDVADEKEASPSEAKECNYRNGRWVSDNRRPLYSGFGCKQWLSESWSCRLTQRTDFDYEQFRWQPEACEMPEFEATQFLRRMQDKTIAYVGDSLGRQMFQSMMCMVTAGKEQPDVEDVGPEYGFVLAPGAKRPDGWAYRFPSTNTTILYHWSSTLCDLEPLNPSDPASSYAMHLDRPPAFVKDNLHRIHVLVLNTGHHWNRGKLRANKWEMYVGGAPNNKRNIAVIWKAKNFTIHSIVKWMDAQLPHHPHMKVFYRSISPRHFFNGDWDTGGSCDNTSPLVKGSGIFQNHSDDADAEGATMGTRVNLLDITALSRLRDEGHISRYSIKATQGIQDCLHWCLPGVPDTWNEILAAQL